MRAVFLLATLAVGPSPAFAQAIDLTVPEPAADALANLRLAHHAQRREGGIALLVGGAGSAVGGGVLAAALHDDPFWLSFGLGSAAWGLVNAALSITMLDVSDGGRARIEEDRGLRGSALVRARQDALRRQHDSATLFALNLGLDVAYLASGVLLFFVADQLDGPEAPEWMRGYAVSQLGQGGFLFLFDLIEWIASGEHAEEIANLEGAW